LRYLIIISIALSCLLIYGCKKEEPYNEPLVNVLEPAPYQTIEVPGTLAVKIRIVSERTIESVRISVDDHSITAIYPPEYFSPAVKEVEIDENLPLGVLPEDKSKPFYFHVAVDDGIETNHHYVEVILKNTLVKKVIGYYLLSRPSINKTRVEYLTIDAEMQLIDEINGEYVDAASYSGDAMVYVATENQAAIRAYQFDEEEVPEAKWEHFPALPFPEITDLYLFNNLLYAGTGNSTIDGFDHLTGVKKSSTDIALDSVPQRIGVSTNHIIGDFYSRKEFSNALQSFFFETGYFIQRKGMYYRVIDFYPAADGDSFYHFGTSPAYGFFSRYHIPTNSLFERKEFSEGPFTHSAWISESEYLVASPDKLYRYRFDIGKLQLLASFPDTIRDLIYDDYGKHIYVVLNDRVHIFNDNTMEETNTISSTKPLHALRLRYNY
jgi:hypothetical protein